jgi:hypothetical protein
MAIPSRSDVIGMFFPSVSPAALTRRGKAVIMVFIYMLHIIHDFSLPDKPGSKILRYVP